MDKADFYSVKSLFCFPSSLYSSDRKLNGNEVILPEYFNQAYEYDKNQGLDGFFVRISSSQSTDSKLKTFTYAFVLEMSANKNTCFLSQDIFQKLKLMSGDKVNIQLVQDYQKAKKIQFHTTNIRSEMEFQQILPDIEVGLYKQIPIFRCLQIDDCIEIENKFKLIVQHTEPCQNFVVMKDTDVEVHINFGTFIQDIPQFEYIVKQETDSIDSKSVQKTVKAVVIGTGEIIESFPMQQQQQHKLEPSYNPKLHQLKKL